MTQIIAIVSNCKVNLITCTPYVACVGYIRRHGWSSLVVTKPRTGHQMLCAVNLCAKFGSNRLPGNFSAYTWNITLLSLFNALSIFPSLPFFSCARPQVERLNQYWWLLAQTTRLDTRKCLLGMRMMKKYIQGVCGPKNRRFFQLVYPCPMLLITVYWKLGSETDWNVNNDSQESTPSPTYIDLITCMHLKALFSLE